MKSATFFLLRQFKLFGVRYLKITVTLFLLLQAVDGFSVTATIIDADDSRPDDQFQGELFGRPVTVGGEYEFVPSYRKDVALEQKPDDYERLDQKIEIEMLYFLSDNMNVYIEGKYKHKKDLQRDDGNEETKSFIERGQTWIEWDSLSDAGFSARIGRQTFSDKREWWWDEDLDALRLFFSKDNVSMEYAIAKELGRISSKEALDPEDKDIRRMFARVKWEWAKKQRLGVFWFKHNDQSSTMEEDSIIDGDDEDEIDADLTWYGLRFMGRIKQKHAGIFQYWIDTGYVQGKERIVDFDDIDDERIVVDDIVKKDVEGWGFDVGVTWITDLPRALHFTLGYAKGSGDSDPDDDKNKNYQQTGLHDNNHKFDGVNSFKYYGELLRPELSNIGITTVAVGFSLMHNSSFEVLYHDYNQVYAMDDLRGSKLRIRPEGDSRDVGQEIDMLLGLEEWKHLELELAFGFFKAGRAFNRERGDTAKIAVCKLNYNF